MSDISIKVISDKVEQIDGLPSYIGEIKIKDIEDPNFSEKFVMSVAQWSVEDYKKQWNEGLERIKSHDTSCLITNVQNPEMKPGLEPPMIIAWAMYKAGTKLYIRNQFFFSKMLIKKLSEMPFNVETCYQFIGRRNSKSNASEWQIDLKDL